MSHPDEGLIHSWIDGELDAAEAARVEALVRDDPAWAAAAAEARGLIAASSRIIGALDHVPANVVPITRGADRRAAAVAPNGGAVAARRGLPWWAMRAAAVLVVATGTAVVFSRTPSEEVSVAEAVPGGFLTTPAAGPAPALRAPTTTDSARDPKDVAVAPASITRQNATDRVGSIAGKAGSRAAAGAGGAANEADMKQRAALNDARVEGRFAAGELARRDSAGAAKATSTDERRLVAADQAATAARPELKKEAGASAGDANKTLAAVAQPPAAAPPAAARSPAAPSASQRAQAVTTFARDECYRETSSPAGGTPVVHHVSRTGDTTAVPTVPLRMRMEGNARPGVQSGLTYVEPARPMRVRGDTLFAVVQNGPVRIALRITCPAP